MAAAFDVDVFGFELTVGDFDGDGFADLVIGAPAEDLGSVNQAGGVNVLDGSAVGPSSAGNPFWHQDKPGIEGVPEEFDLFGLLLLQTRPDSPLRLPHRVPAWL